jgi:solute carrier family 25 phosphate transporter 3
VASTKRKDTNRIKLGTLTAGQFAIYGDVKKAFGAVGGVEISG